jgi:hypothetical protein
MAGRTNAVSRQPFSQWIMMMMMMMMMTPYASDVTTCVVSSARAYGPFSGLERRQM